MKSFILKRTKDGVYISVLERDLKPTLGRQDWINNKFVNQFELIGEEVDNTNELEELFGKKDEK